MDILSDVKIEGNLIVPSESYDKGIQFGETGPNLVEMGGYILVVDKDGNYNNDSIGFYANKFCVGGPLMIYENEINYRDETGQSMGIMFVFCGDDPESHLILYDNFACFQLRDVALKETSTMTIPSGCNRFHLDYIRVGVGDMPLVQAYVNNKTVYLDYEISGRCVIASMSNGFSTPTNITFRVS